RRGAVTRRRPRHGPPAPVPRSVACLIQRKDTAMLPRSTLRARLLLGLGLCALALALPVAPTLAGVPHAAGRLPSTAGAAGACTLPLVHDHYLGFHSGVPSGWTLSTFDGAIGVSRDPSGSEVALLYPALL